MIGLADLVEGAVYLCTSDFDKAMESFRACLDKRRDIEASNDAQSDENNDHISAFALFELAMILIQEPVVSCLKKRSKNFNAFFFKNLNFYFFRL